jgi:outer membrane protein assembly factor BamB
LSAEPAPLGSPEFFPTPEHPVGWRGDWTGRYPGATPPLEWSRRALGVTRGLAYQANKPANNSGKGAVALENFTIKDWLVAGPFAASDTAQAMSQDFLGGEAAVLPSEGDNAGSAVWKLVHVAMDNQTTHIHNGGMCKNLNVDFVYAFGKFTRDDKFNFKVEGDLANKVAYAHTYIFSVTGGMVNLTDLNWGAAAKAWLNGRPLLVVTEQNSNVWNKKEIEVELRRGWNSLLVKVASGESGMEKSADGATSHWRMATYLTPAGPIAYETKNIAWMTRLTGRSMSQPIVVGDKIFLGSGVTDLICIRRTDGKVLWIRSNTPWDALESADKSEPEVKEKIAPLAAQLDQVNAQATVVINSLVSPRGMSSDQQDVFDKQLKAKTDLEAKIHNEFRGIDRRRFPPMSGNEVASSNAAPCSDGQRVYWACGGGMKGPGASVVCCYDLNGKRIWSHHEAFGASEHGLHTSPVLADGKLIYAANHTLVAYDAATGKEQWRQKTEEYCGESPQIVRIGGEACVLSKHSGRMVTLHRVSDGTKLAAFDCGLFGEETPIVENGVVYIPDRFKGWNSDNVAFTALELPVNDNGKFKEQFQLNWARDHVPLRGISFWVASPLFVDGLVYTEDMSGGLMAVDVAAQKSAYRRWLDWYARYDRYLYGAVASPTLGGKNIYLVDNAGYTIILKPGPTYQEIGRNVIENISPSSISGNPNKQEAFYSSPVFVGSMIYLRGEEYLYAIGGGEARPRK